MVTQNVINIGSENCLVPLYLNQWWLTVSKVSWHSSESIIIRRSYDTNQYQYNKIDNYIFAISDDRVGIMTTFVFECGNNQWAKMQRTKICNHQSARTCYIRSTISPYNWWVLCQKQVSMAGTSNYAPQYLWDVITCPCPWYLLPASCTTHLNSYSIAVEKRTWCILWRWHWKANIQFICQYLSIMTIVYITIISVKSDRCFFKRRELNWIDSVSQCRFIVSWNRKTVPFGRLAIIFQLKTLYI